MKIRVVVVSKGGRKGYKRDVQDKQLVDKPFVVSPNIYHTLHMKPGLTSLGLSFHGWKVKRLDQKVISKCPPSHGVL